MSGAGSAGGIGSRLDGTASTHLVRLLVQAARQAGAAEDQLARVTGTDEVVLRGELNRIPMSSLLRLWELIAHARPGAGSGAAIAAAAPLGSLNTWDYLVTTGETLADSLRAAQPYHRLVTAATEGFDLSGDGDLTIGYRTSADDPAVASVVNEYVLAYYLRRAREAIGRPLAPIRVSFSHAAPADHAGLVAVFGTADIEFEAEADSITFHADDANAPLARADPMLADLMRSHADLVLASARPIADPLDAFRIALGAALDAGDPALPRVAKSLAMSQRTLQRHLAEHGTSWRDELDLLRHERARILLDRGHSTATIAQRLAFTDDRALRKAFHRWTGTTPTAARAG
ncbi:AraC family transcriptional regulator ligand-binding domain-containing protein [Nocardia sp. PE-7]|uniref:AraC family transcriptional regulator n=1 Tax=Nocardia sp. PE-7 TaxID=3058426 RepID=UPI00265959AB|nr:AraC family transcriptional regulator [Nocardia sp. PE-7]WKG09212.1 AraC family transcriptional regulator ligand-binding domain-containing protein [Nocardia sp. PE-7]